MREGTQRRRRDSMTWEERAGKKEKKKKVGDKKSCDSSGQKRAGEETDVTLTNGREW